MKKVPQNPRKARKPVRKIPFALLVLATAFAISPIALAQQTGDFSFASATAIDGFFGSGTFTTDSGGVITDITGTLFSTTPGDASGAMTLLAPGTFASNDNLFTDAAPYLSENGLSFEAGGTDYNIYFYATSSGGYEATNCTAGEQTCITANQYGVPSTPVSFEVSNVTPEPSSLLLLGTGLLGLAVVLFRREKASSHSSIS
jgi:hypothetical protein